MSTQDLQKRASNQLSRWLELEGRIVSYRELARELKCNVHLAKRFMLEHLKATASLQPTFLVTGQYLTIPPASVQEVAANGDPIEHSTDRGGEMDADGQMNGGSTEGRTEDNVGSKRKRKEAISAARSDILSRRGVVLAGGVRELEDQKQYFDPSTICVHIYALSKARVKDPAHFLQATGRVRMYPRYFDSETYGGIRGNFGLATSDRKPPTDQASSKAQHVAKSGNGASSSSSKVPTGPSEKAAEKAPPAKRSSKASNRIASEEPETAPVTTGKSKTEDKSELSMPINNSARPLANSRLSEADEAAAAAMMDMDDDFDQPGSPSKPPPMEQDADDMAQEEKAGLGGQPVDSTGKKSKQNTSKRSAGSKAITIGKSASGRYLKRRRISKTVMKTDKKGYMYTEDVSTDEEYSSDNDEEAANTGAKNAPKSKQGQVSRSSSVASKQESEEPDAKPRRAASSGTPQNTTTKGAAKPKTGQQTMLNFFKKK